MAMLPLGRDLIRPHFVSLSDLVRRPIGEWGGEGGVGGGGAFLLC